MSRAKGIDISKWQLWFNDPGNLDFIIVKASEGVTADPKFEHYLTHIQSVPVRGAYHYYRTALDPIMQAEYFMDLIATSGHNWHFLAVDYENTGNTLDRQGAENLLKCLKHIRTSQELPVLVYTGEYIYRDNMRVWREEFDDFPLWVARYSEHDPGSIMERSWDFWQWTSSANGEQAGVGSEFVDRNVYNGTVEQLFNRFLPEVTMEAKKWYQSKTLWFSILFALVNVAAIFGYADFVPGDDVVQYVNIGVSVIVALLRAFTNQGVKL